MHGNLFYTLQDFLTHSEGITYIIVVCVLFSSIAFWKFLNARGVDD